MKPNWFVALPVEAGRWLAPLLASAPRTLRPFHADDLHLTLAFLGGCSEEQAMAAWAVASALPVPDFQVTLAGLAAMGNPRKPSALAVALHQGHDEVARYLGTHRDAVLQAASARLDDRPPLPHITIGRPPRDCSSSERSALLAWARQVPPIGTSARLNRLALYTWAHDRRVRQFRIVASRP